LKNDANTSGDVLVYGMGYARHQYSPLTLVNKENVNKLVPIWGLALSDNHGGESFPVVKDGVIYATTHNATVAVDALTGKLIWRINHDYPPETLRIVCCGIVNCGAAIYNGKITRALLDNHIIALASRRSLSVRFLPYDAGCGSIVWRRDHRTSNRWRRHRCTGAPAKWGLGDGGRRRLAGAALW
jgi:glucose dehydrogenase